MEAVSLRNRHCVGKGLVLLIMDAGVQWLPALKWGHLMERARRHSQHGAILERGWHGASY